MSSVASNENFIRIGVFAAVLAIMAILEALFPRRKRTQGRGRRWVTNLGLVVIDSVAVKLLVPITALAAAEIASAKGWGLFALVDLPVVFEIVAAVILLDLAIYGQHIASHKLPILWRFHKVHHADRDIDVTTGTRFHPVEIVLSMFYKCLCVLLIGPAVIAVFIFEVVLNATAMFNHANVRLPSWLDRGIRMILVTPDMHRVHHSVIRRETDSNYGFSLSVWDRLFRTYIPQPAAGHDRMTIGLSQYQTSRPSSLTWCLNLPFRSSKKAGSNG